MRLEPMQEPAAKCDDPFYALGEIGGPIGDTLSNNKIDRIVYGA